MNLEHLENTGTSEQEQPSDRANYWTDIMLESIDSLLQGSLPDGMHEDCRTSLECGIQDWVIEIRKKEIQAIIRNLKKRLAALSAASTTTGDRSEHKKRLWKVAFAKTFIDKAKRACQ